MYGIFGDDVFKCIISGDKRICNRTVVLARVLTKGYDRTEGFIPDMVIRSIENKGCLSENQYEIADLQEELEFFKSYNQVAMKERFEKLDADKLL